VDSGVLQLDIQMIVKRTFGDSVDQMGNPDIPHLVSQYLDFWEGIPGLLSPYDNVNHRKRFNPQQDYKSSRRVQAAVPGFHLTHIPEDELPYSLRPCNAFKTVVEYIVWARQSNHTGIPRPTPQADSKEANVNKDMNVYFPVPEGVPFRTLVGKHPQLLRLRSLYNFWLADHGPAPEKQAMKQLLLDVDTLARSYIPSRFAGRVGFGNICKARADHLVVNLHRFGSEVPPNKHADSTVFGELVGLLVLFGFAQLCLWNEDRGQKDPPDEIILLTPGSFWCMNGNLRNFGRHEVRYSKTCLRGAVLWRAMSAESVERFESLPSTAENRTYPGERDTFRERIDVRSATCTDWAASDAAAYTGSCTDTVQPLPPPLVLSFTQRRVAEAEAKAAASEANANGPPSWDNPNVVLFAKPPAPEAMPDAWQEPWSRQEYLNMSRIPPREVSLLGTEQSTAYCLCDILFDLGGSVHEQFAPKLAPPLGGGTFGVVYRGCWKKTIEGAETVVDVAVKFHVRLTRARRRVAPRAQTVDARTEREVEVGCSTRHPNLIQTLGGQQTWSEVGKGKKSMIPPFTVMPIGGYTLARAASRPAWRTIGLRSRLNLASMLCLAVMYLHERMQVRHRDLKSDNILLFIGPLGELNLFVADFGLVVRLRGGSRFGAVDIGEYRTPAAYRTAAASGRSVHFWLPPDHYVHGYGGPWTDTYALVLLIATILMKGGRNRRAPQRYIYTDFSGGNAFPYADLLCMPHPAKGWSADWADLFTLLLCARHTSLSVRKSVSPADLVGVLRAIHRETPADVEELPLGDWLPRDVNEKPSRRGDLKLNTKSLVIEDFSQFAFSDEGTTGDEGKTSSGPGVGPAACGGLFRFRPLQESRWHAQPRPIAALMSDGDGNTCESKATSLAPGTSGGGRPGLMYDAAFTFMNQQHEVLSAIKSPSRLRRNRQLLGPTMRYEWIPPAVHSRHRVARWRLGDELVHKEYARVVSKLLANEGVVSESKFLSAPAAVLDAAKGIAAGYVEELAGTDCVFAEGVMLYGYAGHQLLQGDDVMPLSCVVWALTEDVVVTGNKLEYDHVLHTDGTMLVNIGPSIATHPQRDVVKPVVRLLRENNADCIIFYYSTACTAVVDELCEDDFDLTNTGTGSFCACKVDTDMGLACTDISVCHNRAMQQECEYGVTCRWSKRKCGNRAMQLGKAKGTREDVHAKKGRILQVVEPVRPGEFVVELKGERVSAKRVARLIAQKDDKLVKVVHHGVDTYIRVDDKGSLCSHSCVPNCYTRVQAFTHGHPKPKIMVGVYALDNGEGISAGAEITIDYNKSGRGEQCHCGASEEAHLYGGGASDACYECGMGGEICVCDDCNECFHVECIDPGFEMPVPHVEQKHWHCHHCARDAANRCLELSSAKEK